VKAWLSIAAVGPVVAAVSSLSDARANEVIRVSGPFVELVRRGSQSGSP